jgi:hypothetical protein
MKYKEVKEDAVNPSYYRSSKGIEVIDIIKEFTKELKGAIAFDIGNVIKYVCRWHEKGGIDDLKKASWYLTHAIETYEDKEG